MEFIKKHSSASVVLRVMLRNSSTGQGLTGLTSASSGLIISTIADPESSPTNYTVAASNIETITTLGTYAAPTSGKCRFKEVDATNQPGLYEFHLADARWAVSSAKALRISFSGATNLLGRQICCQLVAFDPDAVAGLGLTYLDAAMTSRLAPTVAARTLDVSAGGEAGLDWANVGSPTTTVGLSGTTVKAATDVLALLPAALVGGRMDSNVQAMADDVITAAKIATDAIGSAELAASAITEIQSGLSTLDAAGVRAAVGLASANLDTQLSNIDDFLDTEVAAIKAKTDNLPASPAAVGSAMTLAADAITAAVIATNAIDADALAADAVTEIQDGLSTLTAAGVRTSVGLASANLDTQLSTIDDFLDTEVAAIKVVTDRLSSMLVVDGAVYQYTANALELAPSGGGGGGGSSTITYARTLKTFIGVQDDTEEVFEFVEDDAYTVYAYLLDDSGNPVNITGQTLTASVTSSVGTVIDAPTCTSESDTLGIVAVAITTDVTGAAFALGYLTIKLDDGSGGVIVTTPRKVKVLAR